MKKELKEREKDLKAIFEKFQSDGVSFILPDSANAMKKVEKKLNLKFDAVLSSFYLLCDGFSLNWKGVSDNFCINGNTYIRPISILDSLDVGSYELSFSEVDNHENIDTSKLLIFNRIDTLGNYVLLQIEQNTTILYLYTYDKKINKLNLTIEEYLKKIVIYFGIELWQQFYIENSSSISNFYIFDNRYAMLLERLLNHESEVYQTIVNPLEDLKKNHSFSNTITIDFRDQIGKNIDYLKTQKGFKLKTLNVEFNTSVNTIMKAQESIKQRLPPSVINFYLQLNGMRLEWNISDKSYGQINLLPLEEVFGGTEWFANNDWTKINDYRNIKICTGEEDTAYIAIASKVRPIELFFGSSGFVGFIVNENQDFDLYYSGSRGEITKLPISFEKYLQLSIRLMGIDGWQEHYSDRKDASITKDNLSDKIAAVFPDFKMEAFFS
jgi:hypothetical protein